MSATKTKSNRMMKKFSIVTLALREIDADIDFLEELAKVFNTSKTPLSTNHNYSLITLSNVTYTKSDGFMKLRFLDLPKYICCPEEENEIDEEVCPYFTMPQEVYWISCILWKSGSFYKLVAEAGPEVTNVQELAIILGSAVSGNIHKDRNFDTSCIRLVYNDAEDTTTNGMPSPCVKTIKANFSERLNNLEGISKVLQTVYLSEKDK